MSRPGFASFCERQERTRIETVVDMPDNTIDLLFRFLQQNEGRLSKRALTHEFSRLRDDEVLRFEQIYAETFGDME
jgi:hypothetical protein